MSHVTHFGNGTLMPESVASHRQKKQQHQQQAATGDRSTTQQQQQPTSYCWGHGDFSQAKQTKKGNNNTAKLALLDLPLHWRGSRMHQP